MHSWYMWSLVGTRWHWEHCCLLQPSDSVLHIASSFNMLFLHNITATPIQAWTGQEFEAARISRHLAHEGGKVVSSMHRPPLPPR